MGLTTDFNELMNSDVSSLLSNASVPKIADISGLNLGSSVSSDKLFKSISSSENASNVFGVFDSKQVVQSLSGDVGSMFDSEILDSLSPDKMKNLMSKLGTDVLSDIELDEAIQSTMTKMGEIKQTAFDTADEMFGSVVSAYTSTGAEIKATLLETVSFDSAVTDVFDPLPSISDFSQLKEYFNKSGISNFNSCDALSAALNYGKNLLDLNSIFGGISGLFGILAGYDISGIVSCFNQAVDSFDNLQQTDLSNIFIDAGAVNSYNDLTNMSTNGNVLNQYDTLRRLGSNSSSSDSLVLDSIFSTLDAEKSSMFSEASVNMDYNDSVLSGLSSPVYDRSAISSSSSGFANYCFSGDGTDEVLSSIPDSVFL